MSDLKLGLCKINKFTARIFTFSLLYSLLRYCGGVDTLLAPVVLGEHYNQYNETSESVSRHSI